MSTSMDFFCFKDFPKLKWFLFVFFSLLSGFSDGTAAIHDIVNQTGNVKYTCKVVCKIDRHNRYKHKTSIQSVCWYPLDTGIFTTSGTDKLLKVWDTNNLIVSINMINENYKTLKLIRNWIFWHVHVQCLHTLKILFIVKDSMFENQNWKSNSFKHSYDYCSVLNMLNELIYYVYRDSYSINNHEYLYDNTCYSVSCIFYL